MGSAWSVLHDGDGTVRHVPRGGEKPIRGDQKKRRLEKFRSSQNNAAGASSLAQTEERVS